MAMAEQTMAQERAKLIVVTRFDGERVAQESKPEPKKRTPKKLPKIITQEQVEKLLAQINVKCSTGLRNMVIFQVAYKAGLRVSEICDLRPADVDLVKGDIFVQLGKGSKDRHVKIGSCLIDWLSKWSKIRPESEYFFCAVNKGTRILPRYLNQVLERLSNRANVYVQDGPTQGPVHMHILRHCFASNLLDSKVNLRQIQQLMGHTSISTTERYLHINDVELDAVIKALG